MGDSVVGRLIYKITGDLGDIKQSLTNTEKRIKNFSKLVQSAAGLFGVITAVKSLISIVRGSVNAFMEQEESSAKLAAALKTTGEYTSTTQKRMENLSSGLQQVTRYGDEVTTSAMAMLMSLGSMDSKMAADLIPHVQDFASAMGMDLESAATLVAKAVEGNVGALSRYGIKIKEGMDKQGRMAALTEALEGKFGGLARAMGDTAGGAIIRLQNAFGDMQEQVGRATVNSLQPLIGWLATVAVKITDVMKASNDLREALKNVERGTADTNDELIKAKDDYSKTRQAIEQINETLEYTPDMTEEAIAAFKKQRAALQQLLTAQRLRIGVLENQAAKEEETAAATAASARAQQEFSDKVAAAYANTEEAQRIALEADIAYWESALSVAGASSGKIIAILKFLRDEYQKKFPEAQLDSGYYNMKMQQLMKFERQQDIYYDSIVEHEDEIAAAARTAFEEKTERDQMRLERMKAYNNHAALLDDDRLKKVAETEANIASIRESSFAFVSDLLSSLGDIQRANLDHELASLEAKQESELAAFEGTEEEKKALTEKFAKEKARLEYDAAMKSWQLQLAGAIVSGAKAILSGFETKPFIPVGLIAGGLATALAAVQLAAIRAAKPVPNFSTGANFTVPAGYPNDGYPMNVESGEHVSVTPAGKGGGPATPLIIQIDAKPIYRGMLQATGDRIALINARSIVK